MGKSKKKTEVIEFCAINKKFVENKLKELEVKYQELVTEANFWQSVLTSVVNIIEDETQVVSDIENTEKSNLAM